MKITLSKTQWETMGKKVGWIKVANVDGTSLEKGLQTFRPSVESLEQLIDQYDSYWSYGVSPDPILEEMLQHSLTLRQHSRELLNDLKTKIAEWEAKIQNGQKLI